MNKHLLEIQNKFFSPSGFLSLPGFCCSWWPFLFSQSRPQHLCASWCPWRKSGKPVEWVWLDVTKQTAVFAVLCLNGGLCLSLYTHKLWRANLLCLELSCVLVLLQPNLAHWQQLPLCFSQPGEFSICSMFKLQMGKNTLSLMFPYAAILIWNTRKIFFYLMISHYRRLISMEQHCIKSNFLNWQFEKKIQ